MRFTNIFMAAAAVTAAMAAPTVNRLRPKSVTLKEKRAGNLTWIGVNESGAEFGNTNIPGVLGTDYTWANLSAIDILLADGFNIFRIQALMDRIAQGTMTATLDATYSAALETVVNHVTAAGAYAIVDMHNFGRYGGQIITSTADFQTFWKNVATLFTNNSLVIFDTNNEYYGLDQTLVLDLNQAAINGIRAAGATSQYIFVEGNAWSGAWSWTTTNTNLVALTDPSDKIIYEMHQYLDSDSSGTSEVCVSTTIGVERVTDATTWLRENGKIGVLGEFAGGVNEQCEEAVENMLDYLSANSDVWMGALWWAAGPWWGTYLYSLEPGTGVAYDTYVPILQKYM